MAMTSNENRMALVGPEMLTRMPENPNHMGEAEYAQLVANIRADGNVQPMLVRHDGSDDAPYEVIDGDHRLRASIDAGLAQVWCMIVDWPREKAVMYRLAMNKLRGKLNLTEVGRDFRWLIEECGMSADDLAVTGFDTSDIGDLLESTKSTGRIAEEVLASAGEIDLPDENASADGEASTFPVEIECRSAPEKRLVMRRLKKLAAGAPLVVGLLRALGEEDAS